MKLSIHNLSAEYTMQRTQHSLKALQDLSFEVPAGSFTVIVGPSGCGKTTLLNILAGLQVPSAGEILLDGQPIEGPGHNRAMVFQSPALLPWRTVLGNVCYGLELQGYTREQSRQAAMRYIRMTGLSDFLESYPRELSGGMKQRVNLARALATSPGILLMDEPLASLDPQMRELLQLELQRVWLQTGTSAVYVTHLIDEAIFLADEIIVLSARPGRIKRILKVDFERPRSLELKKQARFHELSSELWDLIEEEIVKSTPDAEALPDA